ncbi:DNA primase [Candidatus Saccharibacteria bacterium]|nr:MAG: DNA primase [Candidatus Saccharibacteria bacterium]
MADALEEVKARLNIEDIVGEYVQLKRSGRNYKGLSPFTNEKTPSFIVSPEKQIWHDFSSGRGGSMFDFVMELEGLDFKGALELLARKAGVELEDNKRKAGESGLKKRLLDAHALAANFYTRELTKNDAALNYVRVERGFSKETILEFKLGYSPTDDSLTRYLLKKGFSESELSRGGLSTRRSAGLTDMFRGRIMVPLMDGQGQVIGFTARQFGGDNMGPKYLNTPATPLYDKSRHVYGLSQAKQAIRNCGYVVVAEGNLDVISSHQAGVKQVVATAGTAMTSQHFLQLKRFTGDVRLAFDADKAGLAATERAIPLAQAADVTLSIITIAEGKDPDELVRKDVKLWQKAIDEKSYAIDWLIDHYRASLDITSAVGKRRLTDIVLATVRKLNDQVEQEHYVSMLASIIGASAEALKGKLQNDKAGARARKSNHRPVNKGSLPENEKRVQHFLSIMLLYPSMRELIYDLPNDLFQDDQAAKLFNYLQTDEPVEDSNLTTAENRAIEEDSGAASSASRQAIWHASQVPEGHGSDESTILKRGTERAVQVYSEASTTAENRAITEEDSGAASSASRQAIWHALQDYVKMLALLGEETYGRAEKSELQAQAKMLQSRLVADYVRTQKQILVERLNQNPTEELLHQAKALDELVKRFS